MNDVDYLDRVRSELNRAEKLFNFSSDLITSTEYCLLQARQNLALHEDILNGGQYVAGADSPEIESVIRTSKVGVRYYGRQIEKIEKDLEEYRKIKNEAENDWKRANSEIVRANIYFRKLALVFTLLVGCAAPQNKSASLEYLRDSRDFSTVSVYGGAEVAPQTRFFGNLDLNSQFNRADTSDLTRFNGRARLVRPLYNGFDLTAEYKDAVGDNNAVGGVGVSYSPISGVEIRAYPLRTDGESQELGVSVGKVFEAGKLDPYVRGFFDVGKTNKKYSVGEIQFGLKTETGWRFGVEGRYSDLERRSGFEGKGVAAVVGLDF